MPKQDSKSSHSGFPKRRQGLVRGLALAPPAPFLTRSSCRCVSAGMAGNGSPRDLPSASGTFKTNPEANSCRRRKLVHSPLVAPELLHFPGPSLGDSASRGPLNSTPHSFALSPGASCPDTQLCSHRGREAKWEEEETRLRPDRGPELDLTCSSPPPALFLQLGRSHALLPRPSPRPRPSARIGAGPPPRHRSLPCLSSQNRKDRVSWHPAARLPALPGSFASSHTL